MKSRRPSAAAPTFGLVAAFSALVGAAPVAYAAGIEIPLDQVRIVTFKVPVRTVFVGNPVIADITVIDSTHVFVLGKNFGSTNIVALDSAGREAVNEQVTVHERPGSAVTVQRGNAKTTLVCTSSRCETAPTPGDDKLPFETATGQIEARETLTLKAASQ